MSPSSFSGACSKSERAVGAVILEAPFTSAADAGQRAYPLLPVKLLIKDSFDSLGRINRIGAPLLIIHGEEDRVVPVDHGRRLLAAAQAPKQGVFLPGAGHNDGDGGIRRAIEDVSRLHRDRRSLCGRMAEGAVS